MPCTRWKTKIPRMVSYRSILLQFCYLLSFQYSEIKEVFYNKVQMWKWLQFIETRKHILNQNLNVQNSYISVIFQIPRAMLNQYLFSFQTMPLLCWMTGQSNVSFVRNIMDGRKEIQKVSQRLDNWLSIQLEWMNRNWESHSNRFWSCHQDMLIPSLKTFESNNHVFLNPIVSFLHFYLCFL